VQMLRDQIGQQVHPVHRLDKGTSGVLLFALDRETAALVGRTFERQDVTKTYVAVVRGHPAETGVIDHPLVRQFDNLEHRPAHAETAAQSALTRFRRLAVAELPRRPLSDEPLRAARTRTRNRTTAPVAPAPQTRVASDHRRRDLRQGTAQSPLRKTLRYTSSAARLHQAAARASAHRENARSARAARRGLRRGHRRPRLVRRRVRMRPRVFRPLSIAGTMKSPINDRFRR